MIFWELKILREYFSADFVNFTTFLFFKESPQLEDDPLLEVFSRRINQDVDDNDDQYQYHDYNNYDYPEADNFYEYPEDDYELQDDAM